MKKQHTHLVLLIDRSGSMSTIQKDMEGGLKEFIANQKKEKGKCTVTAVQFDDKYDVIYDFEDIQNIEDIAINPRGSTALVDSMCKLINTLSEKIANMPKKDQPNKVLFITITDGEENSSREYTSEQLKNLIETQEKNNSWDFTYLGANQDAFANARGMGIANGLTYNATSGGISTMFANVSTATARYRSAVTTDGVDVKGFSYTQDEINDTLNSK